jgi:methionyl-tRNA synthetase
VVYWVAFLLSAGLPFGATDFTTERLVAAYHQDLANTVGNLPSRALPWRAARQRGVPPPRLEAAPHCVSRHHAAPSPCQLVNGRLTCDT